MEREYKMKINEYILKIKKLGACEEAVLDAHNYETSQELWDKCERGDWMLWLIGRMSGGVGDERRKQLVLTACKCARLTLPHVKKDELRPLKAIETAEQWARGENGVTLDDVRAAANAAAYAAVNAANAADAANAAANAAVNAADAAADAAKKDTLKQCADIVRKDYPDLDDILKGGKK